MKMKNLLAAAITIALGVIMTPFAFAADVAATFDFIGTLDAFLDAFPVWLSAIITLVAALNTLAALTSTKKDDEILAKIGTFLKALSGFYPGKSEGLATRKRVE